MTKKSPGRPSRDERNDRVVLPLDPETALRALLAVDPDQETEQRDEPEPDQK